MTRPWRSRWANQAEPCGPSRTTSERRRHDQELVRESPARKVAPGLRAASEPRPARPAFGDEDRRAALIPHALGRREIRPDAGERAQRLADFAEIEGRLEVLDEAENVALGLAVGIPPPCPAVRDDDDLASGATILQAVL
jgi:hypothetical protein